MEHTNDLTQERINQKLAPEKKHKKSKGVIIATVSVVLCVIAIVVCVILFKPAKETGNRNQVVTPDNVDEVLADLGEDEKAAVGSYNVKMNTTWNFEDGSSASKDAYVENSVRNSNDVYFDIVDSSTGEQLFSSPTIPVGSHLESITLDTKLSKGEYPCLLTYHLLDSEGESISTVKVNLNIVVEN